VAWTLNHEILFYLMFLTLIVQRRLGILLFTLWAAVIASWPLGLLPNNFAFEFLASPYNMEFFMGMGAAYLVLNSRVPSPRLLALLGICAFFAVGMMENAGIIQARTNLLSETLFGASAATIVLGLAAAEIAGKLSASKSASFLGEASYSIYLIHVAIIGWTAHVLQLAGVIKAIPGWAAFFFVAASALTVALLLYEFVEKRALTWLNDFGRSHIYGPLRQREVRA
jgi:peptidoglycan/LPS O-acetylase OafA/YrhL